jgi:hypothetical protein
MEGWFTLPFWPVRCSLSAPFQIFEEEQALQREIAEFAALERSVTAERQRYGHRPPLEADSFKLGFLSRFEAEVHDHWYVGSPESDARRIKLNVGGQVRQQYLYAC